MDNIRHIKCSKFDSIFNPTAIKTALIIRGSRKIFGDGIYAEKYLKSLEDVNFSLPMDFTTKSKVEKHQIGKTEYLVFGDIDCGKIIMYLHGGAFVRHLNSMHIKMIDFFALNSGCCFVVPLYLTAPKYKWQECCNELIELYKYILNKCEDVIFMGDSAGGAIAITIHKLLNEQNLPYAKKLILFSPFLDISCKNKEMVNLAKNDPMFGGIDGLVKCSESWAGNTPLDSPYINPIFTEMTDLPEMHIYFGTSDMLYPDSIKFYKKAKEQGADITLSLYDKMYHIFPLLPVAAAKKVKNEVLNLL